MTSGTEKSKFESANGLIRAIAETGDRAAFAELFSIFAPVIKAYLRRSGCAEGEAEELAQETMLSVWRKAHQFEVDRASASAWIFTIARNLRVDGLRRRPMDRLPPEMEVDGVPLPDAATLGADTVARLQAALSNLPAEQAEVVRAAYVEHHTHAAIAKRMGLPLGTVKSRLRLALKRLRAELEILP